MINRISQAHKKIIFILLFITSFSSFSVQALFAKDLAVQESEPQLAAVVKEKTSAMVTFEARSDHDFLLFADYYYAGKDIDKNKSPGVIVLHDCRSDRSKYSELAKTIAAQGMHVLALDFRGYGDSVAAGFSQLEIKKHSKDIVSYQSEIALITSYWAEDLTAAHHFLRTKVDKSQGIAVVASGCSASYAVALAEKIHLSAMIFITPEMSYADKERYKNLIDTPSYFISSAHHLASYSTAQELFAWNGAAYSKIQTFKGNRRDRQLITAKLNVVSDIARWLKFNLR